MANNTDYTRLLDGHALLAIKAWVEAKGYGTVKSIKVGNTSYSPSSGVVSLPAYPTTLPASDVYAWAKASTKPSYNYGEIGAGIVSNALIDVHPESAASTISYYTNDLVNLLARGGTCTATNTTRGTTVSTTISNWFDGSPTYGGFSVTAVTDVVEILISLPSGLSYSWGTHYGIGFGNAGWRAKDVKIESGYESNGSTIWKTVYNVTNSGQALHDSGSQGGPGTGGTPWNRIRITLTNFAGTSPRIAQIWTQNYGSKGLALNFVQTGGSTMYGTLNMQHAYPRTSNAYDLGSSSYQWNNAYAKTIYENGTALSSKYAAKIHTHKYLEASDGRISSANITHFWTNDKAHLLFDIATSSMTTAKPASDGWILSFMWDNSGTYNTQIYIPNTSSNNNGKPQIRYLNGGSTWTSWETLSLPASDVYSWAKASTKPSYTYSEVGAAAAGHNHDDVYVKYSAAQTLTDAQKTQARSNIGAGTSSFTGYTSSNKLSTNYIQNDAGWSSFSGYSSSNKLSTDYINNVAGWTSVSETTVTNWGFTKNAGTVTSVGAGTGLSISGTASVNPTVNIASGYKLPTTSEWNLAYSKPIIMLEDNSSTTAGTWLAKTSLISALADGQLFLYKLTVAGASTTTLNVSCNGTASGAKTVYRVGTTKLTTHYGVGSYILLYYNGTSFYCINDYDANSYAYLRQYQHGSNAAGTGTLYPILTRYNLTNKNNSYDTAYARYHTNTYIDTSNGYLYAPKVYSGGSEVLTGITSAMVTTALGYTPGTSNFTGYTSSNKLHTDYINNAAGWTSVTESTVSGWGFTKNAGTVTQVKVGTTAYNPSNGVISLPAYPTVPTNVSAFANDAGYITSYTNSYHDPVWKSQASISKVKIATGTGGAVDMYLPVASATDYGLAKAAAVRTSAITATTGGTTSNRYYGVELDSNGKMFVNVPWSSGISAYYANQYNENYYLSSASDAALFTDYLQGGGAVVGINGGNALGIAIGWPGLGSSSSKRSLLFSGNRVDLVLVNEYQDYIKGLSIDMYDDDYYNLHIRANAYSDLVGTINDEDSENVILHAYTFSVAPSYVNSSVTGTKSVTIGVVMHNITYTYSNSVLLKINIRGSTPGESAITSYASLCGLLYHAGHTSVNTCLVCSGRYSSYSYVVLGVFASSYNSGLNLVYCSTSNNTVSNTQIANGTVTDNLSFSLVP